jgi:hypothetical protein
LDKSAKTKLISDIENQLDDFFSENKAQGAGPAQLRSLEKLKSAVLSIDWEISDACLSELIGETENLLPQHEKDPFATALLRMLRGLGRYIRKRKVLAHQDAIKRIMSVFASLEMLIDGKQLGKDQKNQIVTKEIQAFKKLKEQIDLQRPSPPPQPPIAVPAAPAVPETSPDASTGNGKGWPEPQNIKQVISDMEQRLRLEVQAVKSQLATLEKELNALRRKN